MISSLSALSGLALAALLAVALTTHLWLRSQARQAVLAGRVATALGLVAAVWACVTVAWHGALTVSLLQWHGWGLVLRFDPLSVTMFSLVSFVGVVVVRFSARYLDGDPRQAVFVGRLCLTLAGVSVLVLAGNLLQLAVGWVGTSLALHRLLLFYPERPRARRAAAKKFVVARLGDACLLVALVALGLATSTADIGELAALMQQWAERGAAPASVHVAAIALVLAACFKSAQIPAHGWLIDVVETPTPVSALLHAGLINAGGFLVIRLADVVVLSAPAMTTLVVIGGATAVVGSLVMLTQARVKNSLAYSTVAQMGFMLLQCGLGAFTAALVHLVAHSLYKAHAFLGSGSAVAARRLRERGGAREGRLGWSWHLGAVLVALAVFVGVGAGFGFELAHEPGVFVLGGVLSMAMAMWLVESLPAPLGLGPLVMRLVGVGLIATLYFTVQALAREAYGAMLPSPALVLGSAIAGALILVALAGVTWLQWSMSRRGPSPRWAAAYVRIRNGLDLDTYFERWIGPHLRSSSSMPETRP